MNIRNREPVHLWVITWLLMMPLFYFASQGNLWFQSVQANNSLSYKYGPIADAHGNGGSTFIAIIVFVGVFATIFPYLRRSVNLALKDKVFISLALLAAGSCLWSQFPTSTAKFALCMAGNILLSFYLGTRFRAESLLRVWIILGWICVLFCLFLCLFFPRYGVDQIAGLHNSWKGMYAQKNDCAMMTTALLIAAFYVPTKTMLAKFMRTLYLILSVVMIVMTQARGGWLLLTCLLICVIGVSALQKFSTKDRLTVAFLFMVGTLLVVSLVVCYSTQIFYFIGKDPTLTGRTTIWKMVLAAITKQPILGYGYKAFWRGLQGQSANATLGIGWIAASTHNGFLDVWLTLGIGGLALVVYSFLRSFCDAIRCLRMGLTPYLCWCICIVMLVFILSFDETQLMQPNNLIWIMYVMACVGLSNGAKRASLEESHE